MLALVEATALEMPFCAPACWAPRAFVVWPWTCVSEVWPLETPFLTADVADVLTALIADIAPGSVCLIACEASRPLAWKVEPIFEPWLLTPETTWAPCSLTLPAVSPETLDATFALPSAAASLTPPPPPDWPLTEPAVELIEPWTLPEVALTAAVPCCPAVCPACWASVAPSLAALCVLAFAWPCQLVTWEDAAEPADVTLALAPLTAA